jgi:hypothetical protein
LYAPIAAPSQNKPSRPSAPAPRPSVPAPRTSVPQQLARRDQRLPQVPRVDPPIRRLADHPVLELR